MFTLRHVIEYNDVGVKRYFDPYDIIRKFYKKGYEQFDSVLESMSEELETEVQEFPL